MYIYVCMYLIIIVHTVCHLNVDLNKSGRSLGKYVTFSLKYSSPLCHENKFIKHITTTSTV